MSLPPTGTVTFLFTDIEGSTRLWEQHPDAMRPALARHDDLLRQAHRGQRRLRLQDRRRRLLRRLPHRDHALWKPPWPPSSPWPPKPWETADAAARADGPAHRGRRGARRRLLRPAPQPRRPPHGGGARRAGAALGRDAGTGPGRPAAGRLPAGPGRSTASRTWGGPSRSSNSCTPSLPADFPPLRSLDNPDLPNNLPQQLTSFIGREKQVAEVKALLAQDAPADADRRGRQRQDPPVPAGGRRPARPATATASGSSNWPRCPTPPWCRRPSPRCWACSEEPGKPHPADARGRAEGQAPAARAGQLRAPGRRLRLPRRRPAALLPRRSPPGLLAASR